jgi:glutamyl-tRNA reductase
MNLAVLGINFRSAPIEVREKATFLPADAQSALRRIAARFPASEAVLVSTCNRTELYTAGIEAEAEKQALTAILLKESTPEQAAAAESHFYLKSHLTMAEHLLAVTAGLDSMVVGETEILGQIKAAHLLADQTEMCRKGLGPLFQTAFRIAKRVHTETDLCRGRVSVASIAVEFAEKVFEDLGAKTVMIVGAGETAELALKSLVERGARDVLVLNRSLERAQALAERHGGRALQFELLADYLPKADIVISSTSAPHFVIHADGVRQAMAVRRGLPLLLIDIAMPRDIDPAAGGLENVYLYHIDDLQRIAEANLSKRRQAVDGAWKIIRTGAAEIAATIEGADLREMMRRLDVFGREASETILQRFMGKEKLATLPEETREEIRVIAQKVVAKMLANPRETLKRVARNGQWDQYANVVNDLFAFNTQQGAKDETGAPEKGTP